MLIKDINIYSKIILLHLMFLFILFILVIFLACYIYFTFGLLLFHITRVMNLSVSVVISFVIGNTAA